MVVTSGSIRAPGAEPPVEFSLDNCPAFRANVGDFVRIFACEDNAHRQRARAFIGDSRRLGRRWLKVEGNVLHVGRRRAYRKSMRFFSEAHAYAARDVLRTAWRAFEEGDAISLEMENAEAFRVNAYGLVRVFACDDIGHRQRARTFIGDCRRLGRRWLKVEGNVLHVGRRRAYRKSMRFSSGRQARSAQDVLEFVWQIEEGEV